VGEERAHAGGRTKSRVDVSSRERERERVRLPQPPNRYHCVVAAYPGLFCLRGARLDNGLHIPALLAAGHEAQMYRAPNGNRGE